MSKFASVFKTSRMLSRRQCHRDLIYRSNSKATCVNYQKECTGQKTIRLRERTLLQPEVLVCGGCGVSRYSSVPSPPSTGDQLSLSEAEYEIVCQETLDAIAEKFEDIGEMGITDEQFDVSFASGVITVQLGEGKGTFVINKQSPNQQIWLSSPFSGPKRYDFISGTWIYKHDGRSLHSLLSEELSNVFSRDLDFTVCSYGKPDS